ncbi:hypothetical protein HPP92_002559 [Vanilla planifolia]|uniref:Chloroplast protein HCF243 n=1 Tax=Vanilla planifolia TaxID=51239 RepID=A0A835SEW9_VANPL|nr:hypothetical protein HPP92_002559 [Vanilla planifolia]
MGKKRPTAMEGGDRERCHAQPHRSGSSGGVAGDFFVCFTARPSSSSASAAMRVPSSKALMSPGRGRDASSAPALSGSLSRRLRSSGSVKGGQSPMFPSGVPLTGRKKGCAFESSEPSSPKVTCIGQVRVKAKKKGRSKAKAAMATSRSRRGRGGEVSFRREEGGDDCVSVRNQGWVHQFPLSICGGRSLCGSGCNSSSSSGSGEEKRSGKKTAARWGSSSSSCGALLARWLMAVQESEEETKGEDAVEEGKKVEVGFLLVERDEKVVDLGNVMGEKGEMMIMEPKGEDGEEEAARVSVCIPPKNALLLMRCRSDPVRMAALAQRFWGSPASKAQCDEEELKEEDSEEEEENVETKEGVKVVEFSVKSDEVDKEEDDCDFENTAEGVKKTLVEDGGVFPGEKELLLLKIDISTAREGISCRSRPDVQITPSKDEAREETKGTELKEGLEEKENTGVELGRSVGISASKWKEKGRRRGKARDLRRHSFSFEMDAKRHSFSSEKEARRASFSADRSSWWSFPVDKEELGPKEEDTMIETEKKRAVTPEAEGLEEMKAIGETESKGKHETERNGEQKKSGGAGEKAELPDCLLMMLYEPKLSMEVSKETWVCPDDFISWRVYQSRNRLLSKPGIACKAAGESGEATQVSKETTSAVDASVELLETLAALPSTPATVAAIQQKAVGPAKVAPYEPFVLTRCKSEPVRPSVKLVPDVCFWKDRHLPVGAAGLGF